MNLNRGVKCPLELGSPSCHQWDSAPEQAMPCKAEAFPALCSQERGWLRLSHPLQLLDGRRLPSSGAGTWGQQRVPAGGSASLALPVSVCAGPNVTATSPALPGRCSRFEFECQQLHKCIPNWKRCDGVRDCQDSTDERNCRECGQGTGSHRILPWGAPWEGRELIAGEIPAGKSPLQKTEIPYRQK